jgi:predicted Zn-dependent peptidase
MKIVLLSLLALPLVAAEKQTLPKDLPAYGTLKPVRTPAVKQMKLDNGMTVWLVPEPGFPKVAFTLAIRGGYTADPEDRPGMADLIGATVTQGTTNRSAKQLAEDIAASGGDLSADATADTILIETSVLSGKTDSAVKLLADVMQNASFADAEVEIAKNNLISNLEASEADPSFLGRRALYRALFGSHPYSITAPTKDAIAKTTAADLRREYARRFRPERTLLVVAGDFTEQAVTPVVQSSFGAWKASGEAAPIDATKPSQSVTKAIVYVPRPNSVQTGFYIGTLGPVRADADYAAARVANAIYGGMFGSRLVSNIREDKGYTYSPGARLAPNREAGIMMTSANVRNPVTGASFNEISYELNRMATTAPEASEIESAKRYILGSTALQLQSRQSVTRTLARLWIDSLPPEELGRQTEKVEAVKPEDVQAVGRKYFPAWRMTVVAVGEEKVIKDELAPFGLEFQKAQ